MPKIELSDSYVSKYSRTFDSGTYGMQSQDPNYMHPGNINFDEYQAKVASLRNGKKQNDLGYQGYRYTGSEWQAKQAQDNYNRQIEQAKAGHS